jgi:hypothetical protein
MLAAIGLAYLILGFIMLFSAYHTHRFNNPEFTVGLVTGISFGIAMVAFITYATING